MELNLKRHGKSVLIGLLCSIMATVSGCASGGFKLTRTYARFVNGQNIIIRIVLYLFTFVVFAVTMLIDSVVFNTIDFWEGRVSGGKFNFSENGKEYFVLHEKLPGTSLRKSTIEVFGDKKLIQKVVMSETLSGEIELYVDEVLRAKVKDITTLPMASIFDKNGKKTSESWLLSETLTAKIN